MLSLPLPAVAQVGATLSIDSDYRYRGYSVSGDQPTATAMVTLDDRSGVFANLLLIGAVEHDDPMLAGGQATIGYAKRVGPGTSVEAGLTRIDYRGRGSDYVGYSEAFVGATFGHVTTRLYLSPDYFRRGATTGYVEVDGAISPAPDWGLNAHVGRLEYLSDPPRYTARGRFDWRVGVNRQFGRIGLHGALSGRGAGGDYFASNKGRLIATAGASLSF